MPTTAALPAIPALQPVTRKVAQFSDPELLEAIRSEALARLRVYKAVTCTAEKWDRMLALLDLCRGQVDEELAAEISKLIGD